MQTNKISLDGSLNINSYVKQDWGLIRFDKALIDLLWKSVGLFTRILVFTRHNIVSWGRLGFLILELDNIHQHGVSVEGDLLGLLLLPDLGAAGAHGGGGQGHVTEGSSVLGQHQTPVIDCGQAIHSVILMTSE